MECFPSGDHSASTARVEGRPGGGVGAHTFCPSLSAS